MYRFPGFKITLYPDRLLPANAINKRKNLKFIMAGGRIDELIMCPHHQEDACDCRKPNPGFFFRAHMGVNNDLSHSILVGDVLSIL